MKKYNTILFDLDGTLLNTLEDLAGAVNHVLKTNNEPERTIDEVRRFVGNGIRKLMIRAVPDGEDNPTFEQQFKEFSSYYLAHDMEKTDVYSGIPELLQELNARGISTAIVSNKYQPAVTDLADHYFKGMVSTAVGQSDKIRKKPAPDMVYEALDRMGIDKEKKDGILYVGDSDVDSQTAANAGLDCILCSWGFRDIELLKQQKAEAIISSPEELLKYV